MDDGMDSGRLNLPMVTITKENTDSINDMDTASTAGPMDDRMMVHSVKIGGMAREFLFGLTVLFTYVVVLET